jgi:hypothetical protein
MKDEGPSRCLSAEYPQESFSLVLNQRVLKLLTEQKAGCVDLEFAFRQNVRSSVSKKYMHVRKLF